MPVIVTLSGFKVQKRSPAPWAGLWDNVTVPVKLLIGDIVIVELPLPPA